MLVFYIEKEMHNAQFQTFCLAWHGMAARHEPIRWAVGTKLPSGCLLIKSFIQYLMSLLAGVRGAYERSRYYTQMKLELWEIVFQSGWWGIWDYGPNKNNERKQWYWGQSSNKSIWVETKCFSTRFRIRVKVRLLAQADYAITLTMIGIVAALKKRVHKIWTSVESKRRHT